MIELPYQLLGIPCQMELLVGLISADNCKGSTQISALLLLQKKRSVCAAEQSRCAGDHFKLIPGLLLACVMHHEQAHTVFVGKLFHPAYDVVIVGVAVSVGADLSDLLQGINDNQPCVGMVTDKLFKLFVKPCAELFCIYGEV